MSNYLDVQDKVAALGSPLSDADRVAMTPTAAPNVDDLVKKYAK